MGSLIASDDAPPAVVMRGADGQPLQGFCPDPTQRHEMRYFSRGAPTKLYRDGVGDTKVEGYDDISAYLSSITGTDTDESRETPPSEQGQDLRPKSLILDAEDKVGDPLTEVWHGTGEPSLLSESRRVARADPEVTTLSGPGSARNAECGHCGESLVAQDGSLGVGTVLDHPAGLHWRFVDQTAGSVTLEMDIREDMRGAAGSVEDAVVASLAEVAGVSAIGFDVGPVATEHLGVSFLAPAWVGPMRATATAQLVGTR